MKLQLGIFLSVILQFAAFADTASYNSCVSAISATSTACTDAAQLPVGSQAAYNSGQNAICDLNHHVLENVNHMFCFLKHQMNFDGSATGSATVSSSTYAWTFATSGLESFATTQGYSKKLTITKDGVVNMILWWDGSDTSSKGYLISNKVGIDLSNELAIYVQWDKSSTSQWVRYLRGTWVSGTNTGGPCDANGGVLNRIKYGYMKFNTATDEVNTLEIVDVKGNGSNTNLDCDRYRIWGKNTGTLGIWAATTVAYNSTAVDTTGGSGGTYPVSTGVSGGALSSFATTVDSVSGPGNFSKSCNDVYGFRDGGSGNLFDANSDSIRLTFTTEPTGVFGNAAP